MSKTVATNRKAYRDFFVIESIECGIELKGSEVKSIRDKKINLEDSFARIANNEIILYSAHISPYAQASYMNVDPVRPRKLLLHRGQIDKLTVALTQRGLTMVPLKAYFNDRGIVKIELALCKGKKLYDRREDMKRKEADRMVKRVLKQKR
ncbi:MAG TPA: SsrA-binding protein SmpB [Patescibacteria group bacterium]|nr:SsrA-binding protein SmpB [Patescibacteria group bacterium]